MSRTIRPTAQIDRSTGKTIKVYPSVRSAAAALGVGHGNIAACARGAIRSAHGYLWKYVESHAAYKRVFNVKGANSTPSLERCKPRVDLVVSMAKRRELATVSGDREGLMRLASEYAGLGAKATAQQILGEL